MFVPEEEPLLPLWRRVLPWALMGVMCIGMGVGMYLLANSQSGVAKKPVQQIVKLRVIQPPPPPPPPPPKMDQPRIKQEFKPLEAPPPLDDAPPALDAKGEGPGDAFGLAGREGGADYLGGTGTGGTSAFAWYATIVQQQAQDAIQNERKLRRQRFDVKVQLWVARDGRPARAELVRSSGNKEVDRLLTDALAAMERLPEVPPKDMPQPVVLRVSTS